MTIQRKIKEFNYSVFKITKDEILSMESKVGDNYMDYNVHSPMGKKRDPEEIKLKVILSRITEEKVANYIKNKLFLNDEDIIRNFFVKKEEIFDIGVKLNGSTITCELRTSFPPEKYLNNENKILDLSLIGNYKTSNKKREPEKDAYFQIVWPYNFYSKGEKNIFNSVKKCIEQNVDLEFNLMAYGLLSDFKKTSNLSQGNSKYNIIRPLNDARGIESIERVFNILSERKLKKFRETNLGNLKDYYDGFFNVFEYIYENNYYIRLVNDNKISIDITENFNSDWGMKFNHSNEQIYFNKEKFTPKELCGLLKTFKNNSDKLILINKGQVKNDNSIYK